MLRRLREGSGFLALALLATWPLARHFTSTAPGTNEWQGRVLFVETPVNLWNLWWFRHAIVELGQSPFACDLIFHPLGADLWYHTLSPLPALVGVGLQTVIGLVPAHNTLVLLTFVLSAMATAALGRSAGLTPAAANFAGAIYAFAPSVIGHLYVGHFELLWTCWLPIAFWLFLRIANGASIACAMLLGATLAGAAYTSAYYALYSIELLLIAAVVRWRDVWCRRVVALMAVTATVAVVTTLPLLARFVGNRAPSSPIAEIRRDFRLHSVEAASFVSPSFANPLAAAAMPLFLKFNRGDALPQETTGALGLTTLVLIGIAMIQRGRAGARSEKPPLPGHNWRLAMAIAATFLVLALGAEWKWLGRATGLPLPAAMFANIPVLRLARAPGRHMAVAMLGVALLAAAGWQCLGRRRRLVTAIVLAVEFNPAPFPLFSTTVSEAYGRLARERGTFAVLDVPVGLRDGVRLAGHPVGRVQLAQTVHGHPIVSGMVSRLPEDHWRAALSAPLIGTLLEPPNRRSPTAPSQEAARAYFAQWNIRALVIHPHASPDDRALIERTLSIAEREAFSDGTEIWWLW